MEPRPCIFETFSRHARRRFQFEFFPPKTDEAAEQLFGHIRELEGLKPSFVSVTYGAGGSTRERTHNLVVRIKETTALDAVPHLTCVMHGEAEIEGILQRYAVHKVSNILALGGDPPRPQQASAGQAEVKYDRTKDAFKHTRRTWCGLSNEVQRAASAGMEHGRGRSGISGWRIRDRGCGVSRGTPCDAEPDAGDGLSQGEGGRGSGLHCDAALF